MQERHKGKEDVLEKEKERDDSLTHLRFMTTA